MEDNLDDVQEVNNEVQEVNNKVREVSNKEEEAVVAKKKNSNRLFGNIFRNYLEEKELSVIIVAKVMQPIVLMLEQLIWRIIWKDVKYAKKWSLKMMESNKH